MATSGTISKNIGKNGVYTLWIDWSRNSKSDANNTSNITVTLKARRNDGYTSYGAYNNYGNNTIRLTVGGSVKVNNTAANIDLRTSTGVTLATWTGDVAHNTDGTLSLSLEGYFYFNSSAASSLPKGGYTVNGTASLDTIPRKSSVTCTDANVGSSAVITISRASSSFSHTLTYSFGSLNGTIVSKTANTSIGWTLPDTFYGQMPTRTLWGTITCETFNGDTSLGTTTCTFTATAVDTVTVSGSVIDTNSTTINLTGDSSKLIKYFSTAKATIGAATNNSATISSKTINGAEVTSEKIFENCETSSFIFYAKDSRDYSNSVTVKPDMIQYIKLTNNASVSRVSPTGDTINLSLSGNFFNESFGAENNTLTCKYRYCISGGTLGDYQTVTATKSGNSYSYSVTLSGFDYQNSYAIEVVVSDELMTVSKSITLLKGTPVFDWGENDFKFNVPVEAPSFSGSLFGNADSATKATKDGNGDTIPDTYLKRSGGTISGELSITKNDNDVTPVTQNIVLTSDIGERTDAALFPGIGFHIPMKNWASLKFFLDGSFRFYDSSCSGYMPVYASTFHGDWSGFSSGTGYMSIGGKKICFGSFSTGTYTAATATGYNYYGDVSVSVTFPSAFSSSPTSIILQSSGGTSGIVDVEPVTWSASGITKIRIHRSNSASNVAAGTINYIAIL